ncbi:Kelch repeat-containing protein [Chondromyces apiculatus]|uniref:Kelch domain protein n=1 Tax=Chondromyces apiculatus DSM 436 TaxID=1192034 RepID=A0A017STG5_9BACT|nr:kelch repeat-containing protein [Chondromyces apiculatus]EYF00269.1 kelch domain protein [Chondromyces apiculatus DSM 436]
MRFPSLLSWALPACAGLLISLPAAAQSWVQSSMPSLRPGHGAAVLPDGDVLVAGGYTFDDFDAAQRVDRYDAATGTWSYVGDALEGHYVDVHAFPLPDGRVLVGSMETNLEIYDPVTNTSTPTGAFFFFSDSGVTQLPDGDPFFVGGGMDFADWGGAVRFDVATNAVQGLPELGTPRRRLTATGLADGRVLTAGGFRSGDEVDPGGTLATVEIYDPVANAWTAGAPMLQPRHEHRAALLQDGRVFVTGGSADYASLASTEFYDPATGTWSAGPTLPGSFQNHTMTVLPSGRVILVGGTSAVLYDPEADAFTALPSLTVARAGHNATYLPDRGLMITGGYTTVAELYPLGVTGEGEACVITEECASGACEEGLCVDDEGSTGAGAGGPGGPGGPGGGCSLPFFDFSGSPGGAAMLLVAPGLFAFRRRRSASSRSLARRLSAYTVPIRESPSSTP